MGRSLLLLPAVAKAVFLFSRREGDETILPCLCLKNVSIWPLCGEEVARVRDFSRLWPALTLARHTFLGLSLTSRIARHLFCLYSPRSSLYPASSPPPGFQRSSPAGSQLKLNLVPWPCHEKQKCPEPPVIVATLPLSEVRHSENG